MAELILFAGRVEIDFLQQALSGGPHPAEENRDKEENEKLKTKAAEARHRFKVAQNMDRKVKIGLLREEELTRKDKELLKDFRDGRLLHTLNEAVAAFGHGTLHTPGGSLLISASTGGRTRELLDNWQPPNVRDFLRRRRED